MAKQNRTMPASRGGHGQRRAMPVEKPRDLSKTLKHLWKYVAKHKIKLFLVLFFIAFSTLTNLYSTSIVGTAIDKYIIPGYFNQLAKVIGALAVLYITTSLFTWLQTQLCVNIAQNTVYEIRKDLFNEMQSLPLKYFDTHSRGDIMSRVTNDVDTIGTALNTGISQVMQSLLTVTGILVFMLMLSPLLTIMCVITLPVLLLGTKFVTKRSRVYFKEQQKVLGILNGNIEESITGQKVIKTFVKENDEKARLSKLNTDLKKAGINAQIYSGIIGPLSTLVNSLNYCLIAVAGAIFGVNPGVITSFLIYSRQFARPFNEIATQYNSLLSAVAGAERVFEVMAEKPEPKDCENAEILSNVQGRVDFEDVCFGYNDDKLVLKNIFLYAKPGQTIALVGPTGAGKTTIINLLTRFYDIQSGKIKIDNKDITGLTRNSLRANLGIVLQDSYMFSGTIMENVRYGRPDASDSEVQYACMLAQAHEFIRRLPLGYDTVLSEDNDCISQGQKQMLAIARTILANPAILILDEATSNVDTRTEVKIQKAMLNLMEGRTSFVIAHRLSTIRNADLIAVLNNGEIVERGSHRELINKRGFYYTLYINQFSD